jgi:hypothetical protein
VSFVSFHDDRGVRRWGHFIDQLKDESIVAQDSKGRVWWIKANDMIAICNTVADLENVTNEHAQTCERCRRAIRPI